MLFENICGNTCGWKNVWKCVKCCLKTENYYLKTQTKHPHVFSPTRISTNIFKKQFLVFKYMCQMDPKYYIFKHIWSECSEKNNVLKKKIGK